MTDVIEHLGGLNIETGITGYGKLVTCLVRSPVFFIFEANLALTKIDFHEFRRSRVKGQCTRKNDAYGFARTVGHEHGMRSEEHTSELQSLMRNSYAVFC